MNPSTVSNVDKKIYAKIEAWRNQRIKGEHPSVYLHGIVMKCSWAGEVRNASLLVASAVEAKLLSEVGTTSDAAKESWFAQKENRKTKLQALGAQAQNPAISNRPNPNKRTRIQSPTGPMPIPTCVAAA